MGHDGQVVQLILLVVLAVVVLLALIVIAVVVYLIYGTRANRELTREIRLRRWQEGRYRKKPWNIGEG